MLQCGTNRPGADFFNYNFQWPRGSCSLLEGGDVAANGPMMRRMGRWRTGRAHANVTDMHVCVCVERRCAQPSALVTHCSGHPLPWSPIALVTHCGRPVLWSPAAIIITIITITVIINIINISVTTITIIIKLLLLL